MSLHDRPSLAEMLEAVREYLTTEVALTDDRRARFRALIAANVLAIAQRELLTSAADDRSEETLLSEFGLSAGTLDERRAELGWRVRRGDYDAPSEMERVAAYARATVLLKLAVANPKFVERVARSAMSSCSSRRSPSAT